MKVFRIVRRSHADLTGAGGLHATARWHTKGQPILYCGSNRSICVLEALSHLDVDPRSFRDRVMMTIDLPDDLSQITLTPDAIEAAQRRHGERLPWWKPGSTTPRKIGDRWLRAPAPAPAPGGVGYRTSLLIVPSAVLMGEVNVLINPLVQPQRLADAAISLDDFTFDDRIAEILDIGRRGAAVV